MVAPRLRVIRDANFDAPVDVGEVDEREIAALLSDDVVARIMEMLDARRRHALSFWHAEGVFDR